jgi:anti-anti-sigma factor
MHVDEKITGEVAILSIKGEILDFEDDMMFQQKITSLAVDGVRKIVVDLGRVQRLNSRSLSAFISAMKTMNKSGGDIRFTGIDGHVNDIFVETKLIRSFSTYESVGRAVASYS